MKKNDEVDKKVRRVVFSVVTQAARESKREGLEAVTDSHARDKRCVDVLWRRECLDDFTFGPGVAVRKIGATIHALADKEGFGVVEKFVGHGVGQEFHSGPTVRMGDRM